MSIRFNAENKTFYLSGKGFSYVFGINEGGYTVHFYYGRPISDTDFSYLYEGLLTAFSPSYLDDRFASLNCLPQEFALYGRGDYRVPSILIKNQNGSRVTDFRFKSYQILEKKPAISNMPSLRGGETLVVSLEDRINGLELDLYYTAYEDALARRSVLRNVGENSVEILKISSFNIDFNRADFDTFSCPKYLRSTFCADSRAFFCPAGGCIPVPRRI